MQQFDLSKCRQVLGLLVLGFLVAPGRHVQWHLESFPWVCLLALPGLRPEDRAEMFSTILGTGLRFVER